jgi:hypothetical protein
MNPRESDRRESPSGKTETTEAVASVQDNDLAKVKARLTTGRNDPCPCGSGRKYKRCCLTADETFVREAAKKHEIEAKERTEQGQQQRRDIQRATTDEIRPPLEQSPKALEPLSNEPTEADKLWEDLEALTSPTSEQLDLFLEKFLVLPPGEKDWSDLLHLFSSDHPTDLPSVFRRIAAVVPHTKEEEISYFYWAAAEAFSSRGYTHLLPEVAAGFRKLDGQNYEIEALCGLEDYLLAAGFDVEALELDEHFLPILRDDSALMPHVVPQFCQRIYELRVGAELRSGVDSTRSAASIAQSLRRGIEDDIAEDAASCAATIIKRETLPEPWRREDFDLIIGNFRKDAGAWRDFLRLNGILIRVAKEAWQVDQVAPGCAFTGLALMLFSAYPSQTQSAKKKKTGWNLLSYLNPSGIEKRLLENCRGILGINPPKARLFLQAHNNLSRLAARHQLISDAESARTKDELSRLYAELG